MLTKQVNHNPLIHIHTYSDIEFKHSCVAIELSMEDFYGLSFPANYDFAMEKKTKISTYIPTLSIRINMLMSTKTTNTRTKKKHKAKKKMGNAGTSDTFGKSIDRLWRL